MEMEDYKKLSRSELGKIFDNDPVFDYMKLVYELSDIQKADFDGEYWFATDGHFDIFWRYVIGQFEYSFSLSDLQYPKSDNYAAIEIKRALNNGGLDIEKFWWAMVLITVYSDSIFKKGYGISPSIQEQFVELTKILSGGNAMLTCKCDGVKAHTYSNTSFLSTLTYILQSVIDANKENDNPDWNGNPVSFGKADSMSNSYRQMFFECQLYIALFKELEERGDLPKASFDRNVMLAKLMIFTGRTLNPDFDKEDISGILNNKSYKSDPKGGLNSNLAY